MTMKQELFMSDHDLGVLQEVLNHEALKLGRKFAMGAILAGEDHAEYTGDTWELLRDILIRLGFDRNKPDEEQDPTLEGIDYEAVELGIRRGIEYVMSAERRKRRRRGLK